MTKMITRNRKKTLSEGDRILQNSFFVVENLISCQHTATGVTFTSTFSSVAPVTSISATLSTFSGFTVGPTSSVTQGPSSSATQGTSSGAIMHTSSSAN